MRYAKLAMCVVLAMPLLAAAQAPTTQPEETSAPTTGPEPGLLPLRPGYMGPGYGRMRWGPWGRGRMEVMLSDDEKREMGVFMQENSPNRWEMLQKVQDGPMRWGVMRLAINRWRMMRTLKVEDPELYELRTKQVRVEDEIYGITQEAKAPEEREAKRAELKAKVTDLVNAQLAERQRRIARLEKALHAEKDHLANDERKREATIQQRVDRLIREGAPPIRSESGEKLTPPTTQSEEGAAAGQ